MPLVCTDRRCSIMLSAAEMLLRRPIFHASRLIDLIMMACHIDRIVFLFVVSAAVLVVDTPPDVAIQSAGLGTLDELVSAVAIADVVIAPKLCAVQLLYVQSDIPLQHCTAMPDTELAARLR